MAVNTRIISALKHREITLNSLSPVDTYNTNIPPLHLLPSLPHIKKRKLRTQVGSRYVNYQLRYLYQALVNWKNARHGFVLGFATVHFNASMEKQLYSNKKGPVGGYADFIRTYLSKLEGGCNYFFVLERGSTPNKRLHAHILITYHEDAEQKLKGVLRKGANTTGTGLKLQHTYILWHSAKPGSFEYEALELDEEMGMCEYQRSADGKYFREEPISVGSVDYMSKALHRQLSCKAEKNYYAPRSLTAAANELYKAAYTKQKDMNN